MLPARTRVQPLHTILEAGHAIPIVPGDTPAHILRGDKGRLAQSEADGVLLARDGPAVRVEAVYRRLGRQGTRQDE